MQSWGVLGAVLRRPIARPAGGVDIHRSSGSGGGSGGGRAVCPRRPRVRERVSGSRYPDALPLPLPYGQHHLLFLFFFNYEKKSTTH